MGTMYDGIRTDAKKIATLIKPGDRVAYYIDGMYAWTPEEIALFPNNPHVTITVFGHPADVADVEAGAMSIVSAVNWVVRQKKAGYDRPTIYHSLYGMQDVRNATGNLILAKDWDVWVADYDNDPSSVYPQSAAKQYRSTDLYDVSDVYDDRWPHRVKTQPTAPVTSPKWPAGVTLQFGNRGYAVEALQRALATSGIRGVRGILCDGDFGDQTQTAVRNFEAAENLQVDSGIAGSAVRNSLVRLGFLTSAGQATR